MLPVVVDGKSLEGGGVDESRVKGETDFVPYCDAAGWLAVIGKAAAFKIAEVANVVYGEIFAVLDKRRFAFPGEGGAFGKKRIEAHAGARIGFAPDTEVTGEVVPEDVVGALVGTDGETDGGGGAGIGGAADLGFESFAEEAADQGEFTATTGDIDGFETMGASTEIVNGVEGFGDQRFGAGVKIGDGEVDLGKGGVEEI